MEIDSIQNTRGKTSDLADYFANNGIDLTNLFYEPLKVYSRTKKDFMYKVGDFVTKEGERYFELINESGVIVRRKTSALRTPDENPVKEFLKLINRYHSAKD